jgi:hypothetical protein
MKQWNQQALQQQKGRSKETGKQDGVCLCWSFRMLLKITDSVILGLSFKNIFSILNLNVFISKNNEVNTKTSILHIVR